MKQRKNKKRALTFYLERQALRREIEQTRHRIDSARNHFEQVVDPTLIDCYIYELNAAQLRYQFLLRRFKNLEIEFSS
ncbi:MAG: YaaL family protein [Hungatella sp.]|nr:YaaL family protein [Hungatella sp.]